MELDEHDGLQTREQMLAGLSALPSSPVSELVGRLRRSHLEYSDGVPVGYGEPVNPDGPEAADVLTTLSTHNAELEREVKRLREALDEIDRRYRNGANADTLVLLARKAALSTSPQGGEHGE